MAINILDMQKRIESHLAALGVFDRIGLHEPKNRPGRGITAAVWIDRVQPVPHMSGLVATTGRLTWNIRLYSNMLQKPEDLIDTRLLEALDKVFDSFTGDFTLGGTVKMVDLLGATQGHPFEMQSGYIAMDNDITYRVLTITLPLIVNDIWAQSE